jgi:[ribosomal protein S5]-alanine N-acetyltransferase
MNDFPTVVTERLLLRNFSENDANAIYEIFSNESVAEFYDSEAFTHIDQAKSFVNSRIRLNEEGGIRAFRWAICMKSEPNIVIGSCGFHSANKSFSSFEIGYELNQSYWRKNIAFEAVDAMLNYCFVNDFPFSINRISATTNLDSTRSIKLLCRLGFTEEGVLRQYGYWKNKFHDVRLFSILQSEAKSKNQAKTGNAAADFILKDASVRGDESLISEPRKWRQLEDEHLAASLR